MRTSIAAVAVCAVLAGCQSAAVRPPLDPLRDEGELFVYVRAAETGHRIAFSPGAVAALRGDGTDVSIESFPGTSTKTAGHDQRLVASGRVQPGDYAGLTIAIARATGGSGGTHALSVPETPVEIALPFRVAAGEAVVLSLTLDAARSVGADMAFRPVFTARALRPEDAATALPVYCSSTAGASLTAFDRRTGDVLAVLPTGAEPTGLALDPVGGTAYVALSRDDQIQVLDLTSGLELARIALQAGDRPRELALSADGRVLLSANEGSSSVSFVDPAALAETGRVSVGEQPWAIQLDRAGRRAFVLALRGSSVSVVDLPSRTVVASAPTNPEPLQLDLNRSGDRLYVLERGSPYVSVLSTSTLALVGRVFVGPAPRALLVDPFTDLIYVADDSGAVRMFDPLSFLELATIDAPGPVSWMTVDRLNKSLLAVVPSLRSVAVLSTVTRSLQRQVVVGPEPFRLGFAGETP